MCAWQCAPAYPSARAGSDAELAGDSWRALGARAANALALVDATTPESAFFCDTTASIVAGLRVRFGSEAPSRGQRDAVIRDLIALNVSQANVARRVERALDGTATHLAVGAAHGALSDVVAKLDELAACVQQGKEALLVAAKRAHLSA